MQGPERPNWFVGDLTDPWVVSLAERMPQSFLRRHAPGEMPDFWTVEEPAPSLVVLHRAILTPRDVERITRLRARDESPIRVILCFGPHVRHNELVRWSRLFEAMIPEATAAETIGRIISPVPRKDGPRPLVQVVSGLHDMRSLLADICLSGDYLVERQSSLEQSPGGLTVWDVPVLEADWPGQLNRRAQTSAVIAMLGFADRETVRLARNAGADACLEWPCDVDDLIFVLDRTAAMAPRRSADSAHFLPPMPALIRRQVRSEVVDPSRAT